MELNGGSGHHEKKGESSSSMERSDSGKGKSIVSTDLSDDETTPIKSTAVSSSDIENTHLKKEYELLNNNSSASISTANSSGQPSLKEIGKQPCFENVDCVLMFQQSTLNPASIENDILANPYRHSTNYVSASNISVQSMEVSSDNNLNLKNNKACQTHFGNELSRDLSLPPQRFVSKMIMDQLMKELLRAKSKVHRLQLSNDQLYTKVIEMEKRHKEDTQTIFKQTHTINEHAHTLSELRSIYSLVQYWKQKSDDKERDLCKKQKVLETSHKECAKVKDENEILRLKIIELQNEAKTSNQILTNLKPVLVEEREIFERNIKGLKQKIEKLKAENDFLREEPELYGRYSCSQDLEETYGVNIHQMSAETQVKRVYAEKAAAFNDGNYQGLGARTQQGTQQSNIGPNHQPMGNSSVFECRNCYKNEFESYEQFIRHLEICCG